MPWGIEVPEFGRLVSAVTCRGGIEVPETGRLSFVTVRGAPQGGRSQTQNFSLMLVQMLAVCLKMCMKSNWISPIV